MRFYLRWPWPLMKPLNSSRADAGRESRFVTNRSRFARIDSTLDARHLVHISDDEEADVWKDSRHRTDIDVSDDAIERSLQRRTTPVHPAWRYVSGPLTR